MYAQAVCMHDECFGFDFIGVWYGEGLGGSVFCRILSFYCICDIGDLAKVRTCKCIRNDIQVSVITNLIIKLLYYKILI